MNARFKLIDALRRGADRLPGRAGQRAQGLIHEMALMARNVTCSEEELDAIFLRTAFVCVDLGRKSLAAVTVVAVERDGHGGYTTEFVYFLWRAKAFYAAYDDEVREHWFEETHPHGDGDPDARAAAEQRAQHLQEVVESLGKTSCRTCDAEQLAAHCNAVLDDECGGVLRERAQQPEERRRSFRAKSNKRREYDKLVLNIEAHCRALGKTGEPLVLCGIPRFSPTAKGWRPAPTKAIVRKLAATFTTVLIDEYNSSKRCPRCHRRARVVDQEEQTYECTGSCVHTNTSVTFRYNKDISAGINFLLIFLYILQWGERPPAFRPPPSDVTREVAPIHGADQTTGQPSRNRAAPDTGIRAHATTKRGSECNDHSRA